LEPSVPTGDRRSTTELVVGGVNAPLPVCYDDWDNSDLEDQDIMEKEAMHDAEYEQERENIDNLECLPTKPIYNVFDSLTIELLSNKTQYKKYILSKENPEKYDEYMQFLKSCKKHQNSIQRLLEDLLIQPEHESYNKEIKYAFEVFAKTCIKYLDNKIDQQKYSFYEKDEDTLFADMDNDNPIISSAPLYPKSLWGKSIRKI
jgi:hypothetical protein